MYLEKSLKIEFPSKHHLPQHPALWFSTHARSQNMETQNTTDRLATKVLKSPTEGIEVKQ